MSQIIRINENDQGQRIDRFLAQSIHKSRSKIAEMIQDGSILCNDAPTKANYKLKLNDTITVGEYIIKALQLEAHEMPLDIIYEDEWILVLNKARGLVVHPGKGVHEPTLLHGLVHYFKDAPTIIKPGLVHRIDKMTSGLLVIAKTEDAHAILANQLLDKTMTRHYQALCEGSIEDMVIDSPIGEDPLNTKKMAVSTLKGRHAITHISVLKSYSKHTLVHCELKTGRTHQIRVHLSSVGHPIVGDPLYNTINPSQEGQYLCAYHLEFIHPILNKPMMFEVPLPDYFQRKVDLLLV